MLSTMQRFKVQKILQTDKEILILMQYLTDSRDLTIEGLILVDILKERENQTNKWGIQTHTIPEWLMILSEEYGEACKAGNESYFREYPLKTLRKELVQVAAVALAIIQGIDNERLPQ
jgi:hypothetical protein